MLFFLGNQAQKYTLNFPLVAFVKSEFQILTNFQKKKKRLIL